MRGQESEKEERQIGKDKGYLCLKSRTDLGSSQADAGLRWRMSDTRFRGRDGGQCTTPAAPRGRGKTGQGNKERQIEAKIVFEKDRSIRVRDAVEIL